ncbi:hypothetical protein FFLO_03165 [Filobasidium floriforme]|uniref:Uncharacterized protein n=1 Tax=Filobasidium floriforme TaxID=5210 RepID=A0A8K0JRK8_9TREE|nr:hypothetical protein FFLO_03165 [Filobasidium floriforme]
MGADTCSACTQSQVTHQPVTDYMSYCPHDGGSFVKTGSPYDDQYYTEVIEYLNDELSSTAETEEWEKKWADWMDLKAMAVVPQVCKAYIDWVEPERETQADLDIYIAMFTRLEELNRKQNGPHIELEDHQKRKLASVTRAVLNGAAWRLGAYRVFHYYLESEAQVEDLDMGPTFELTIQTKKSSHEQRS